MRGAKCFMFLYMLFLLPAIPGCGEVAHVSGQVVMDGKPYQATQEMVALVFGKDDGSAKLSVSIQPDGSFVVYGPNSEGLQPGKYKVGYYSDIEGNRNRKLVRDLSADTSPLELDLKPGARVRITVDMVKRTMTRD